MALEEIIIITFRPNIIILVFEMSPFSLLPDEVIQRIFDDCSIGDRQKLSLVNKRFYKIKRKRPHIFLFSAARCSILLGQRKNITEIMLDYLNKLEFNTVTLKIENIDLQDLENDLLKLYQTQRLLKRGITSLTLDCCEGTVKSLSSITQMLFSEKLKVLELEDCFIDESTGEFPTDLASEVRLNYSDIPLLPLGNDDIQLTGKLLSKLFRTHYDTISIQANSWSASRAEISGSKIEDSICREEKARCTVTRKFESEISDDSGSSDEEIPWEVYSVHIIINRDKFGCNMGCRSDLSGRCYTVFCVDSHSGIMYFSSFGWLLDL